MGVEHVEILSAVPRIRCVETTSVAAGRGGNSADASTVLPCRYRAGAQRHPLFPAAMC